MRKQLGHAALVLLAAATLAGCTPNGGPPSPTTAAPTGSPTATPTGPATTTPSPDTETTSPAPSPSASPLTSGPGQGDVELSILVKPSESAAPTSYTLVCRDGAPSAESSHPDAAAACAAVKDNQAILSPLPPRKGQVCTQQYGGPQEARVTGVVDGREVEANFSLRDGCEIAAWNAAKAILGSPAGAS